MKRIVVGSDRNAFSANALARAILLAVPHGAAIRIVNAEAQLTDDPAQRRRVRLEALAMAEELTAAPLYFSVRISASTPEEAILDQAEAFRADLIVLGAHGEPRLRDAIFGTTASHIIRHAACPILVVQKISCDPYAKLVVAVDDTRALGRVAPVVQSVAPAAEVFAVHAFDSALHKAFAGDEEAAREESRTEAGLEEALAEAGLGRSARHLTSSQHASARVGEATRILSEEVDRLKPDLLVMGSHRRVPFLDSHAVDALFWCPSDLLIIPDRVACPGHPTRV